MLQPNKSYVLKTESTDLSQHFEALPAGAGMIGTDAGGNPVDNSLEMYKVKVNSSDATADYLEAKVADTTDVQFKPTEDNSKIDSIVYQLTGLGAMLNPVKDAGFDFENGPFPAKPSSGGRGIAFGRRFVAGVEVDAWVAQGNNGKLYWTNNNDSTRWKVVTEDDSLYTAYPSARTYYGWSCIQFVYVAGTHNCYCWVMGSGDASKTIFFIEHKEENYNADGTFKTSALNSVTYSEGLGPYSAIDIMQVDTTGGIFIAGDDTRIGYTTDLVNFQVVLTADHNIGGMGFDGENTVQVIERDYGVIWKSTAYGNPGTFAKVTSIYVDDVEVSHFPVPNAAQWGSMFCMYGQWLSINFHYVTGGYGFIYSDDGVYWYTSTDQATQFYDANNDGLRWFGTNAVYGSGTPIYQLIVSVIPAHRRMSLEKGAVVDELLLLRHIPDADVLGTDHRGRVVAKSGGGYTLPIASDTVLGGIKVGANLTIDVDGTLNAEASGVQGPQGFQGAEGAQGASGAQGPQGDSGTQGSVGAQGPQGATGSQGVQGSQGATGAQGSQGAQGSTGAAGAQGANGAQGAQGSTGAAGSNGAQGANGAQGPQGASVQGPQGVSGADGSRYECYSSSPNNSQLGSKTFEVVSGLSYTVGQRVVMAKSYTEYMYGKVTEYWNMDAIWYLTVDADYSSFPSDNPTGDWGINLIGDGAIYATRSNTNVLMGAGQRSFTVPTGLAYTQGQCVVMYNSSTRYMYGTVVSYNLTTLTIDVKSVTNNGGSYAYPWTINLIGDTGAQGVQGSMGLRGATGDSGAQGAQGATGAQGYQGVQGPQGSQGNQGATGSDYKTTSTSSVTMGIGTKSFTVASGLSYSLDQRVVMAYSNTKYMYGRVTSYSGTTLQVSVDFTTAVSVSYASWTINLMGERGSVYDATSENSLEVSTGSKSFNITITTASFIVGQRVMAAATNSGAGNYMYGVVSSYSGSTLGVAVDSVVGSGTWGGWNIALIGSQGNQGAQGAQGTAGTNGTNGTQGAQGAQGNQGTQGLMGYQGYQGNQGTQGISTMNITISTANPSGSGNEGDIWVVVPA